MKRTPKQWIEAGMPLSMEKELLLIREKIRQNYNHKGADKVLVKSAYNEIRSAQGKRDLKLDCGSCMLDINSNLKEWFKRMDARTKQQKELCATWYDEPGANLQAAINGADENGLVTLNERREKLESCEYWDLLERAKKLPQESIDTIFVGGRPPSKKSIIDEILKY